MRRFVDTIPAWQEADAALDRLAGWRARVHQALRDGDTATADALIEEGRNLPLDAAVPFLGDLSGARTVIAEARRQVDAALLNDACETFARLTRSVVIARRRPGASFPSMRWTIHDSSGC